MRKHREVVEGLHSYLGFLLHGFAEKERGRRALNRKEMVELAGQWLEGEGHPKDLAGTYFALGEERFGLIVALSGEGQETTYGFEVQPIQEYFAAAYISNRLANGRAHEVFQTLIYKDYWREVALFLAGLRRPNEKADLVVRAKEADRQTTNQRRQNGRAIVLELLREGVLSQPRHIQTEAMRYATGFLDAPTLRLQRNPRELIDSLSELAQIYESDETRTKIVEIVKGVAQSSDLGLVTLMHRMAANSLPKEEYLQLVLEYSDSDSEARGIVRISHPLKVSGAIEELSRDHMYWEGIPTHAVARHLWSSAMRNGIVPDIVYPTGTHLSLILQFAIGLSNIGRRPESVIGIPGASVPAIWKLCQNIQLIRAWPIDDGEGTTFYNERLGASKTKDLLWTNGREEPLPQDVERCIRKLMGSSDCLISALLDGKKSETGDALSSFVEKIRECLVEPGIVAWIAVRCASELVRSPALADGLGPSGLSDYLFEVLKEFHGFPDRYYPQRMHLVERFGFGIPLAVRMEPGSDLRELQEVMAQYVLGEMKAQERTRFSWLEEITLPVFMVKPLIDLCRGNLEAVLRFIGSRAVPIGPMYYGDTRLRIQDTRRILKISSETDEQEVLRGAAAALFNAKFARIGEPALIQKILAASPDSPLVVRMFNTHDTIRGREEEPELREFAKKVAFMILDQAEVHPFSVVNRAAVYLAELEARPNVPLFEEFPMLQSPSQV